MNDIIVSMKDISFTYEQKKVLDQVTLEIPRGAFIGLVGPNGGGKTTLVKIMLGLLKADEGTVELFQRPMDKFKDRHKIGFVSQKANSFNKGFPATVFEVVSTGLTAKLGYFHFLTKKDKQKILQAIDQVGMLEYANQNIGNLSGGQQQRIFIARALVSEPELLILDEPTVGVDQENVQRFYDLLHQLHHEKNLTLLLITHDTGVMTEHATDIVCLHKTLHFHGDPKQYQALSDKDLSVIYGHGVNVVTHQH